MKKLNFIFFILTLILLIPACGLKPHRSPVSPPPVTSAQTSGEASEKVSPVSSSAPRSTVSGEVPSSASSAPSKSSKAESQPKSSAQSVVSRALSRSSERLVLNSSLPPKAVPKARKPMPQVTAKMPQADGSKVFSQNSACVDYSNASQGYLMVKYTGSSKIKVLVYFNGGSSYYQYNLGSSDAYTTLPLQSGSGAYKIRFMENVEGNSYSELCSTELTADISGSGFTFYPNQYVNYTRSSAAVTKSKSLCANATNNTEKVTAIYKFITSNIKYDYDKANSVKSGYLPSVDSTLSSKKGICFDYAALMTAMCRSQGISTRLIIGNTSEGYHAWNEIYLDGWKRYDATFAAAGQSATNYTAEKIY
jgi:hypothetical protein